MAKLSVDNDDLKESNRNQVFYCEFVIEVGLL